MLNDWLSAGDLGFEIGQFYERIWPEFLGKQKLGNQLIFYKNPLCVRHMNKQVITLLLEKKEVNDPFSYFLGIYLFITNEHKNAIPRKSAKVAVLMHFNRI